MRKALRRMAGDRAPAAVAAVVAVQAVAAVFFIADAAGDVAEQGLTPHVGLEGLIALALLGGVATGALLARGMIAEARRREAALSIASGALSEVVAERFAAWKLTPAEADVATFALKGCDVAEIAALRSAAQGTVRAQLARVYEKAGVSSQAGLASLFLEDLFAGAREALAEEPGKGPPKPSF